MELILRVEQTMNQETQNNIKFCITLLLEQISLILMGNDILDLTKLHESVVVEQTYPKDHCVSKITTHNI